MGKFLPFSVAAAAVGVATIAGVWLTGAPICLFGLWVEWPIVYFAYKATETTSS